MPSSKRLAADEAFLVAALRIGRLDALTREFAREHSTASGSSSSEPRTPRGRGNPPATEAIVAVALAGVAALLMKVPELFGRHWGGSEEDQIFYVRNLSLFAFPCLAAFFAWKRRLDPVRCAWIGGAFVLAAAWINLVPFALGGMTLILAVIHLPIALWLAIGVTYAGGHWGDRARRMNFVRFSGELFLYFVLIALGGGVLTGLTMGMFAAIGVDAEWLAVQWILPCGALGAVLIAAWLVEAKQSVIENMAPVLTRLFTPLFTAVLLVFLGTMAWTGTGIDVEREVLIAFDLLLVVVVGLLLYAISARDPQARPGVFDWLLLGAGGLGAAGGRPSRWGRSRGESPNSGSAPTRPPHWVKTSSCSGTSPGPPGCSGGSSAAGAPTPPSSAGRWPTCRFTRCGRRWSWWSSRRSSTTCESGAPASWSPASQNPARRRRTPGLGTDQSGPRWTPTG